MPDDLVTISTSVSTIPSESDYYGNTCIVGGSDEGSASAGQAIPVSTVTQAEAQFGAGTDLTNAVSEVLDQGIGQCYAVKANVASTTESSVDSSVDHLDHKPTMLGWSAGSDPPISGDSLTAVSTYGTPEPPLVIDSGEIAVNTYDKAIEVGSTDDISYDYVDNWSDVQAAIESIPDLGVVGIAGAYKHELVNGNEVDTDTCYDESDVFDYGDVATIANMLGAARAVMPLPVYGYDDSTNSVDTSWVTKVTTDVSEFQNKGILPVAHMFDTSVDEMNGVLAGTIARNRETDKLLWKKLMSVTSDPKTFWTTNNIDTLESSQVNAVIQKSGKYVLSNGYSSSTDTLYQWLDVARTQYLIEDYIRSSLNDLIGKSDVPFNQKGINMVKDAIETGCRDAVNTGAIAGSYINDDGNRVNGYKVSMPLYENISDQDKTDRTLNDVEVTAKLPGHIHEINMIMSLMI